MKQRGIILLPALLLALLTGCFFQSDPDSLYALPELSEEYNDLQSKISMVQSKLAAQGGSVEFAAPLMGENTQAIQLQDLDGDSEQECAVAFFRVSGAEHPLRIYIFRSREQGYEVAYVIEGDGAAVNSVYYTDLDGSPGKELVVSWQMSEDVYLLTAYTLTGSEPAVLMRTTYTMYEVADLDRDGLSEIALIQLDPVDGNSRVDLYDYRDKTFGQVASASLSEGVTGVVRKEANYLSDLIPALYVTSDHGEGEQVTDIFAVVDGMWENITLDAHSGVSVNTIRVTLDVEGADINNDYILEIPRFRPMPALLGAESFYSITWEQYSLDGSVTPVCTTFHNTGDGWYLLLPEKWQGKVAVQRTETVTSSDSQRAVTFSRWWENGGEAEPFLTIYRFTGNNRTIRATRGGRFILQEGDDVIYAAEFYDSSWDSGLDRETLQKNFKLIYSEW